MSSGYRNGAFALGIVVGGGISLNLVLWSAYFANGNRKTQGQGNIDGENGQSSQIIDFWDWFVLTFVITDDTIAQWLMAALSFVAVCLLWLTLKASRMTLTATQEMARDAREIGYIQNRPWVTISEPKITSIDVLPAGFRGGDRATWVEFSVVVENVGKTPATAFVLWSEIAEFEGSKSTQERMREIVRAANGSDDAIAPSEKRVVRLNGAFDFNLPPSGTRGGISVAAFIACSYEINGGGGKKRETYRTFSLSQKGMGNVSDATARALDMIDIQDGTSAIDFRHMSSGMT